MRLLSPILIFLLSLHLSASSSWSPFAKGRGRLGVGMSNARVNQFNAQSSKLTTGSMVSLFPPSSQKYDTYSAALAATEPLRQSRDKSILSSLPKLTRLFAPKDGRGDDLCRGKYCERFPAVQRICGKHLDESSRIITSLGLSVTDFNKISLELLDNPELKERVMEQAYLYRVASQLNGVKVPLIEDMKSKKILNEMKRRRLHKFAQALKKIEALRGESTDALLKELGVSSLPADVSICSPRMLPFLNGKVRRVCNEFPIEAEKIVKGFGLDSGGFNELLGEVKRSRLFRWKVKRAMEKVGREEGGGEKGRWKGRGDASLFDERGLSRLE